MRTCVYILSIIVFILSDIEAKSSNIVFANDDWIVSNVSRLISNRINGRFGLMQYTIGNRGEDLNKIYKLQFSYNYTGVYLVRLDAKVLKLMDTTKETIEIHFEWQGTSWKIINVEPPYEAAFYENGFIKERISNYSAEQNMNVKNLIVVEKVGSTEITTELNINEGKIALNAFYHFCSN